MNDFVYLRKSRDKSELADPDILAKHRRTLLRAAAMEQVTILPEHIFEEIGSGEHIASRPHFQRLLAVIERLPPQSGGRLWVMDVDRLSRGRQAERALVQDRLTVAGIVVRTAGGAVIDLADPDQRLLYQVKGDLAENELGKYKARIQAAWADMLREGKVRNGMVPFGWTWDYQHKRPVADRERFPVVQALLSDAFRLSIPELSEKYGLNTNTVRQIIRNPFVCGYPARRWKKPHRESRSTMLLPRDEWEWPEQAGDYPTALSRDEWERLQGVIDARRWSKDTYRSNAGWCRDVLRFMGGPDRAPILGRYSCPGHRLDTYELTPPGAKRLYVARSVVHAAALVALQPVLTDRRLLEYVEGFVNARRAAEKRSRGTSERSRASAIAPLRAKLDDLLRREMEAEEDEERLSIARVRAAIRSQITAHKSTLAMGYHEPILSQADTVLPLWQALSADWEGGWSRLTDRQKRALVAACLSCIRAQISKIPGVRAHRREVVEVEYREWVRAWMEHR